MTKHLLAWSIVAVVLLTSGWAFGQAVATSSPSTAPAAAVTAAPAVVESKTATVTEKSEPLDPTEAMIQKIKHPVEWFRWGGDARLRDIFLPNPTLNQEDRHYQTYRFRAWATVSPCKDFDINARMIYEPRHFCQPAREAFDRNAAYIDEWVMSEALVDQLNFEWRNIGGQPLKVKVGRQDMVFGNGWLVLDGTPLDGSRTAFFDAARATYEAKACNTTFDLVYICQEADTDQRIPPFCDKDFHNMEQDEQGVILYASNKSLEKTVIDGYFIYKHDERVFGTEPRDTNIPPWQQGDNADLYTFGGRVAGDIDAHWKYLAEYAFQFGNKNGDTVCAQAFNSQLAYHFNDMCKNVLRVGYEYLSGDRPGTGTNEQFDPLWGRWPQWSELLMTTTGLEHRPGELTNFHRVGFGWSCSPCKNLEWKNDYHLLFRDQKFDPIGPQAGYFDQGCFRGQLLTSVLRYKFNDHVSTHVIGELFFPGDFYSDTRNEVGGFFRYEINFTW
jgi:hypothetical protein